MSMSRVALVIGILMSPAPARAAIITIDELPDGFALALATPGRQLVGSGLEPSINFDIATDVFAFNAHEFGVTDINFANSLTATLPDNPFTVVVVQDSGLFAGTAATAIANQLSTPGPGFFVYFNTGLDMPRLVFSADLSDPTADLAILARLPNLIGGLAQMPNFSSGNFTIVPEPATLALFGTALAGAVFRRRRNTHRRTPRS